MCSSDLQAHMLDDFLQRKVRHSIEGFRFDDHLRIREINREIRIRCANQAAKDEDHGTQSRQQNSQANRSHIQSRNSNTEDELLLCSLFDAFNVAGTAQHFVNFADVQPFGTAMLDALGEVASTSYGDDCGESTVTSPWARIMLTQFSNPAHGSVDLRKVAAIPQGTMGN